MSGNKFYPWIAAVCRELGWPVERGGQLIQDQSWFFCYDDGMTPAEAVAEARQKGIVPAASSPLVENKK